MSVSAVEVELTERLGIAQDVMNALATEAEAEGFELEVQIVDDAYRLYLVRRVAAPMRGGHVEGAA